MIVVDASVVVDVLTGAPDSDVMRDRLGESLHAPHLRDSEVVSAVRGLTLRGHLSDARALDALGDYGDLPVTRWASAGPLRRRAFDLRSNVSAYAAAYVALAEALGCPILTRDRKLADAAGPVVQVVVL